MTDAIRGVRLHNREMTKSPPLTQSQTVAIAAAAVSSFALYWMSSFILEARHATTHFGADSWYYAELAKDNVFGRIAESQQLDRVARFHPVTVIFAAAWMKLLAPLSVWFTPLSILKAMSAGFGAAGVAAAGFAFSRMVLRSHVLVWTLIYALSLGIWYFASIEESKIITASLSALYIASYLHLRENWSTRGALFLTLILLLACFNEVISGFLVAIPLLDALLTRGWHWRHWRWVVPHMLSAPFSWFVIEGIAYGRWVAATNPEGDSHFKMLIGYVMKNEYSGEWLYSFVINWLFFNIAAPTPDASHGVPPGATYKGYFEPSLLNYLLAPVSAALAIGFIAIVAACLMPRFRAVPDRALTGILLALAAYAFARAAFFFVFNPREPLLFSPAATLAQLLIVAALFSASSFPARRLVLAGFAALLFINNGLFILGK